MKNSFTWRCRGRRERPAAQPTVEPNTSSPDRVQARCAAAPRRIGSSVSPVGTTRGRTSVIAADLGAAPARPAPPRPPAPPRRPAPPAAGRAPRRCWPPRGRARRACSSSTRPPAVPAAMAAVTASAAVPPAKPCSAATARTASAPASCWNAGLDRFETSRGIGTPGPAEERRSRRPRRCCRGAAGRRARSPGRRRPAAPRAARG